MSPPAKPPRPTINAPMSVLSRQRASSPRPWWHWCLPKPSPRSSVETPSPKQRGTFRGTWTASRLPWTRSAASGPRYPGTQQLLDTCTVVYLECDAGTVAERIARNTGRPLLAGDAMARWETLFSARRPVYERLADIVIDVRSGTVAEIALHVEERLRQH